MIHGTLKKFYPERGFGFIARDDQQPDAFVHIKDIERAGIGELRAGDRLSFELEAGRNGKMQAINVQRAAQPVVRAGGDY